MRKNKLLLLLALLLTAATGAWATDVDVYVVGNGTGNWLNGVAWDPGVAGNKMTEQNGVYSITFTNVDANSELQFKFAINGTWAETFGCTSTDANELNKTLSNIEASGNNIAFGLTEKADVTISFNLSEMTYMISTKGMKVGDDAAPSAPKHLITATYREQTRSLEQPLPYATTIGELYEAVSGESFSDLISYWSLVNMTLNGISSTKTDVVSIGEFNGASTPVTFKADGKAAVALNFGGYALGIFVTVTPPLYVTMKDGVKDADKWTASTDGTNFGALPIGGLNGSETVTLQYNGRLKVKGVKATSDAAAPAAGKTVDLSTLTADYEAQDGDVLTGETSSYEVTIAAGATVTLDGVTISRSSYCIKCLGDATIILKDGSTNTLTSTSDEYPALSIGDANTTLTIQGSTGVLNVTSGENCAGIGGGYANTNNTCGNIRIEGGVITAQGGGSGSGIGTDCGTATCGDIIITGGTITAKGGTNAAGIGTGSGFSNPVVCGDITIANTVTKVTATKGENAAQSIGKGRGGKATCGTVTIGGTKYWENNAAVNGGDTYLATSPLIYEPSN